MESTDSKWCSGLWVPSLTASPWIQTALHPTDGWRWGLRTPPNSEGREVEVHGGGGGAGGVEPRDSWCERMKKDSQMTPHPVQDVISNMYGNLKTVLGAPVVAQQVKNPTNIHKGVGSIPGLAQQFEDPALPQAVAQIWYCRGCGVGWQLQL